ncbi:hypothetical protein [Mycolicibacterium septicum]|uniref:hypothetical protein n=1 Tax=Mycolicibacterium septicum TaxID=98668 RepID=UPI002361ED2B|nr:hypothetical protein [Mycolicibacterium septicum]
MTDIGTQRLDDRRGWLVFGHLAPHLQRAEDATLHADHEAVAGDEYPGRTTFDRRATSTERLLLLSLGHPLPDDLTTHVAWLSNGLRRRTWPQLEGEQTS